MKKTILVLLSMLSIGCSEGGFSPSKSKVLVIGDSISLGYWNQLNHMNVENVEFMHNFTDVDQEKNARSTVYGAQHIDHWLDRAGKVDLVTYNQGFWDMYSQPHLMTDIPTYKANLRYIISRIQARGLKVIFFTSTFVPINNERYGMVEAYNAAAIEVMDSMNVKVFDLHAVSLNQKHNLIDPLNEYDLHYTGLGYLELAKSVLTWVREEL